jgi:hypothetical protein
VIRCALLAGLIAGCYHPSFSDCTISCASGNGCPDGLSCDMGSHLCTSAGACTAGGDANGDTGGSNTCDWPITATNYDPCAASFPATIGSISVEGSDIRQDSTSSACTYRFGDRDYCLLHVTSMHVAAGRTFQAIGSRPMIIVSDGDIIVDGTITTSFNGSDATACSGLDGLPGSQYSGGGAGAGGYTAGGNGGRGDQGGTLAGAADPDTMLSPLVAGCPGGTGGAPGGLSAAPGGSGGGAIELASKTAIRVSGGAQILANGGGGSPGMHITSRAGGGGGGGAGGRILLEAPLVVVDAQGMVCAVGGGGGTGASFMSNITMRGLDGTDCTPGAGGTIGANPPAGDGGAGGDANPPQPGLDQTGGFAGGGGGGAGGRIRINAMTRQTGSSIVPPPTF